MAAATSGSRQEAPDRVTVRYFAGAQAAAGIAEEELDLASPCTVEELAARLAARHGADLARVLAAASFLVDEVTGSPSRPVPTGAIVDVLPPFAGG